MEAVRMCFVYVLPQWMKQCDTAMLRRKLKRHASSLACLLVLLWLVFRPQGSDGVQSKLRGSNLKSAHSPRIVAEDVPKSLKTMSSTSWIEGHVRQGVAGIAPHSGHAMSPAVPDNSQRNISEGIIRLPGLVPSSPSPAKPVLSSPKLGVTAAAKPSTPSRRKSFSPQPGVVKVILVAYYRGGSSLLGQAFNRNPQAFYWFEPLRHSYREFLRTHQHENDATAHGYETQGQNVTVPVQELHEKVARIMRQILDCELSNLTRKIFSGTNMWLNFRSRGFRAAFRSCLKGQTIVKNAGEIAVCLERLQNACAARKLRVIKTIRLSLRLAAKILEQDPSVVIVYLTRDPRGLIRSRWDVEHWSGSRAKLSGHSRGMCAMMADDWSYFQYFAANASRARIQHVRYEDLTVRPQQTLAFAYAKLGQHINVPKPVQAWFGEEIVSRTAHRWRTALKPTDIDLVNRYCGRVIQQMGYGL